VFGTPATIHLIGISYDNQRSMGADCRTIGNRTISAVDGCSVAWFVFDNVPYIKSYCHDYFRFIEKDGNLDSAIQRGI